MWDDDTYPSTPKEPDYKRGERKDRQRIEESQRESEERRDRDRRGDWGED